MLERVPPMLAVNSTATMVAARATMTKPTVRIRWTGIPASRAASRLPPMAYM